MIEDDFEWFIAAPFDQWSTKRYKKMARFLGLDLRALHEATATHHPLTIIIAGSCSASEAYTKYNKFNDPAPTGGVAYQQWTERQRAGKGLRKWLLMLDKKVFDNLASQDERETFNILVKETTEELRERIKQADRWKRRNYEEHEPD